MCSVRLALLSKLQQQVETGVRIGPHIHLAEVVSASYWLGGVLCKDWAVA